MSKKGKVYLVGAGPGDPGLITVRGLQLLREAELVVCDALVPDEILNEIPAGCRVIDAGKRAGHHRLKQQEITKILIREARKGKAVVRLKGGDPFLLGRGGEEALDLKKARIPFEIVPGVSSANAVPAYAGIPLTHRDINSCVTILTGHGESQSRRLGPAPLDWPSLAEQDVLVLLMGLKSIRQNMKALIQAGKDPKTPVAVIEKGTLPEQRTITGTIKDIAGKVGRARIEAPVVIVVGTITRLRSKLGWFESKPLFAKHILVTRARHQAAELTQRLLAEGARVTEIPTIGIEPPRSWRVLDQALKQLMDFSWLIFTSVNGVRAFFNRLYSRDYDVRALGHLKVAVIGPATASCLAGYGISADVIAESYRAEGLLEKLSDSFLSNEEVLIARATEARSVLPDELKRWGARVVVAPCYRAVIPSDSRTELKRLIRDDPPDLLSFASSSMAANFAAILSKDRKLWNRARKIPAACIGPITARTVRDVGLKMAVQPKQFTIPDLVEAIRRYGKKL